MIFENTHITCLCGSGLAYLACCGVYHRGEQLPETAEALMRSRFTAYARKDTVYLLATWDEAKRPAELDLSQEHAIWHSLQIIECKKGRAQDNKGIVAFKAYYSLDTEDYYFHEISQFVKRQGKWLYVDGVIKSAGKVNTHPPLARNSLCHCGSGKKFKRCCGA